MLAELREKLGQPGRPVSHQAVSQRRAKLQDIVQMPSDVATYIVASREGVKLHRHLEAEELEQVATFDARLRAAEEDAPAAAAPKARAAKPSVTKVLRAGSVKVPSWALSPKHMEDARRMADVYAVLYAFENSMREFIDGHLTAAYGASWWDDPKVVNGDMRKIVERNRSSEKRHRYHSARNARVIYYTDIGHLPLLVQSANGWKVFKRIFPSDKWLAARVEVVETSRNAVAHMNPLERRDIARINLNFEDWLDQIKGHEPPSVP